MFSKSADLYDAIYLSMGKDYEAETDKIRGFVQLHKRTSGNLLLDVACGTGIHLKYLREYFQVEGLDLDDEMLNAARKKFPDIVLHHGDMVDFRIRQKFDVITCLFSSIGYVGTNQRLKQAIASMSGHLLPGGVLLLEPWFSPKTWQPGSIHATFVDQPDLKIARMNQSEIKGNLSFFTFHYLVATPKGIEHFTERHELGLFTHEEYLNALQQANLDVIHDPEGLDGRGLYICLKQ